MHTELQQQWGILQKKQATMRFQSGIEIASCARTLSSATASRSPSSLISSHSHPSSKSAFLCGTPFWIFAQYPRGGLGMPNRLQRFSIALSLTSKDAATDVAGSAQTASSNSLGFTSNFRCHVTRQGLEQVARLGTWDGQISMGVPHMVQ